MLARDYLRLTDITSNVHLSLALIDYADRYPKFHAQLVLPSLPSYLDAAASNIGAYSLDQRQILPSSKPQCGLHDSQAAPPQMSYCQEEAL